MWLLWIRGTGREFTARLAAHRRLGPVIRIGPQEISINCIKDGVRTVYGGNWDKSSMYDGFTQFGFSPLFAIRQAGLHSERKRVFAHVYSKSTIVNSVQFAELLTTIGVDRLLPRLQEVIKNRDAVEVFSLTREYSIDVVTAYIYGVGNGTNFVEHPGEGSHYLSAFLHAVEPWAFFASTEIKRLVYILDCFGLDLVPPSVSSAFDTIHSFVLDLTTRKISSLETDFPSEKGSMGAFEHMWQRLDYIPEVQKASLIASDMVDQIHASHKATRTILTYLMWELSKNSEIQDMLRSDLRSSSDPPSSELLDAVLMETIRLYPAGFGPFPRVAPANATVSGFLIPKGTIASASPYMLGRNSDLFPSPDSWLPRRWIQASPDEKKEMRQWVWMFMSGPRICIGEHLAVISMKAFVVDVYKAYKTTIIGNPDMRQLESFFSTPTGASLLLQLQVI
ncbi:cytochrome P450 [Mollisia scopiformis]|uniref:Cytochrome P450 n=1 Tax=Mollisia scopiformis TaxID=149040 RepID=A0A194X4X9_MOLSC|nr:cytochrome P450 [Mollisia scopiformis]KUJ14862.1 cytochrome P450 [Mollisia scopiformis]